MPQPELPEAAQNRPTEAQKLAAPTEHKTVGKFKTPGNHPDKTVDVIAKTKPNAQGGYDCELHMGVPK